MSLINNASYSYGTFERQIKIIIDYCQIKGPTPMPQEYAYAEEMLRDLGVEANYIWLRKIDVIKDNTILIHFELGSDPAKFILSASIENDQRIILRLFMESDAVDNWMQKNRSCDIGISLYELILRK